MHNLLNHTGTLAGGAGALLCTVAGIARLQGSFHVAGYEATTLFLVGTGIMVFACLVKQQVLLSLQACRGR